MSNKMIVIVTILVVIVVLSVVGYMVYQNKNKQQQYKAHQQQVANFAAWQENAQQNYTGMLNTLVSSSCNPMEPFSNCGQQGKDLFNFSLSNFFG